MVGEHGEYSEVGLMGKMLSLEEIRGASSIFSVLGKYYGCGFLNSGKGLSRSCANIHLCKLVGLTLKQSSP